MTTPTVHPPEQSTPACECVALKKKVNVTVTILSIAGLCVEDVRGKRGRGVSRRERSKKLDSSAPSHKNEAGALDLGMETSLNSGTPDNQIGSAPATVVASFSRTVATKEGKSKTIMTYLPSLPLPLLDTKYKPMVIHWHEQDPEVLSVSGGNVGIISSHQFQRTFQREDANDPKPNCVRQSQSERFVPQPLNIQIAISRQGKMFRLGSASILLSGEENGESSINVPIQNCNLSLTPKGSKFSFRNSGSGDGEKTISMIKLKGETLKCCLDPNATLRVLVHVSDPVGETLGSTRPTAIVVSAAKDKKKSRGSLVSAPTLSSQKSFPKPRGSTTLPARSEKMPTLPKNLSEVSTNPDDNDNINTVAQDNASESLDYNPTLAAVVVKTRDTNGKIAALAEESKETIARTLTHQKSALRYGVKDNKMAVDKDYDADDEPSCSSSAYMSNVGHFGYRLSGSVAHTTLPAAGASGAHLVEDDEEASTEASFGSSLGDDCDGRRTSLSRCVRENESWRQRLSCGALPACGPLHNHVNESVEGLDNTLSGLIENSGLDLIKLGIF